MALWGLHMAMAQGARPATVADTVPGDLRGTAYWFFNLMSGVARLIASGLAGLLWEQLCASFTFVEGRAVSVVALSLLWFRLADKRALFATKIVAFCLTSSCSIVLYVPISCLS